MIHAYLDPCAGFPPVLHMHGGPLSGRTWGTLRDMLHSLETVSLGREHMRVWCASVDALFFMAQEEGLSPAFFILPGQGCTGLDVSRRVQIRHVRQAVADSTLEALAGQGAEAGLAAVVESLGALESTLGVDAGAGIGAATTRALFGGRWMPRWAKWPADAPPEWLQLSRDAYHGGLSRVLIHQGLVTHGTAHPGAIWETERADTLPEGWQIQEVDRDSAYAADALGELPDVGGEHTTDAAQLLDCDGGALVDARVDLSGFTGYAFPVRVQITHEITRCVPMRAGSWRGVWCSWLLRWAMERGAVVEPLGGVGWRRSARYLGPLMATLWKKKHESSGVARETFKAAIQRAVGRLARRRYDTVTLTGPEALAEIENPGEWPVRWRKVYGWTTNPPVFVADRFEQGEEIAPVGSVPAWPAFVVGRTWASACAQMERVTDAGAWPMYVDTDGITCAAPPGARLCDDGTSIGGWRIKRTYTGAEHRAPRQFVRLDTEGREVLQFAGVPRVDQRRALMGESVHQETRTVMIELQRVFRQNVDRLSPVLSATRHSVEHAKRVGRRVAEHERESHHGF